MSNEKPGWDKRVLATLADVPQDPGFHAEGSVGVHTGMVGQAMLQSDGFAKLPEAERSLLYSTTILHDMAKPVCMQHEGGRIRSHGHARRGSIMARKLLYEEGIDPRVREHICGIIRWHMAPINTLNEEHSVSLWKTLSANLAAPTAHLLRHARADFKGRISTDPNDNGALQLEAFEERVDGLGIRNAPFPWTNPQQRLEFFMSGGARNPFFVAHEPSYKGEVVIMSGLPGVGKDTWIKKNLPKWPIVSLDDIRNELGVDSGTDQGPVIIKAKEAYKQYLRTCESFVFNATNVVSDLRRVWVGLAFKYGFRIRFVCIEVPHKTLWERNKARPEEQRVPEAAIEKMLDRWEPPTEVEAHEVERVFYG